MNLRKLKLTQKMILLFLMVGLVPMLVMSIYSYNLTHNQILKLKTGELKLYMDEKRKVLEEWFESHRDNVRMLAIAEDVFKSLDVYYQDQGGSVWQERNSEVLQRFSQKAKEIYDLSEVYIVDNKGKIISATNQQLLDGDLSTRDYIQAAFQGRVAISEIFYSDVAKQNILCVAAPIYSQGTSGQIVGAFCVFLNANKISETLLSGIEEIGDTADILLVNQNQVMLTIPRFNQGYKVLETRIDTGGVDQVAAAVRANNTDYSEDLVYEGAKGSKVFEVLDVFQIGDHPAGCVMEINYNEEFKAILNYRTTIITITALILILVAFIGFTVARSFSKPILLINEGLKKIAEGDLTVSMDIKRSDEIGELADQENIAVGRVASLIKQIIESAERVKKATAEIAMGNQDLSQRTQEQASTLEEISATMEEVTTSIQQVSDNSSQADQLSQTTLGAVEEGETSIKETIEAMNEISTSSNQIAEIIKVVNDIAFQTNLLALNAAVEAARAGEQGRGFAVVAAEVRNLAGRTAESAKEIERLISDSVKRVERGNKLVQKSSEMLGQIVTNTKRTADVIVEVASAMREQSGASQQIQASIEQLNQVTQQNAAMVEEITSSSESMSAEAEGLREVVNQFKVEEEQETEVVTKKPSIEREKPAVSNRTVVKKPEKTMKISQDSLERF